MQLHLSLECDINRLTIMETLSNSVYPCMRITAKKIKITIWCFSASFLQLIIESIDISNHPVKMFLKKCLF